MGKTQKASIFQIFKNHNYSRLFFATFTSQMGREIGTTAFAFYLLERFANQPIYTTLTQMMYSMPTLFVFWIVGVMADRMDRQKIAANSDWISAFLSFCFLWAVTIGWMPLVFALLFLRSAIANFFGPAESALVQGILQKDQYAVAAGLNQMVMSIFMLFGTALGLLFYRYTGLHGAIIVDMLAFLISGWLIRTCKIADTVRLPNGRSKFKDLNIRQVLIDFIEGIVYIVKNKLLLTLVIGFFIIGIANGGFSVILMYVMRYKLDPVGYEDAMVIVSIIFGIGILASSFFSSLLARRMKLHVMVISGILTLGILSILGGIVPSKELFYIVAILVGLCLGPINVGIGGWLPQIVDPKKMGRVQGCINPLMMLSQTLALGVIAITFPKFVNVDMLYYGVGVCLLLVGIFYFFALPHFARKHEIEQKRAIQITEEMTIK